MAIKRAIKAGNKSIISFKKVIKVGEITQWFDKNKFSPSQTDRTLTFTNNGDGSVTVSGVVVSMSRNIYSISNLKELVKGHKYLLSGCPKDTYSHFLSLNVYNNDSRLLAMYCDYGSGVIFTFDQEYYARYIGGIYIYETQEGAEVNRTYIPQLFDLTEMFGAGHEPATVAEFKAKFPEAYYPYQRAVLTVYNKVVRPYARKGEVVQLVDKNMFPATKTQQGVTFTNNGDGSVTANGVSTNQYYSEIDIRIGDTYQWQEDDHKYLLLSGLSSNAGGQIECILWVGRPNGQPGNAYNAADLVSSQFSFTIPKGQYVIKNVKCRIRSGYTAENVTFTPQLFDLTAMYGAGNEPKTLADFRKDFPENYYPYNSIHTKNLWTCNKTASSCFKYDKATQIYTITSSGSESCYKLPSAIPAGQTFTISVKCLSGWIPDDCTVNFGGYHKEGNVTSWQVTVQLPREQDLTGKIFTATKKTTDTLTDFWIFIYAKIPTNLRVMIQFEKGSVATDYVPHDYI